MLSQRMGRLLTACVLALARTANAAYEHYDVPLKMANPPEMKPREYVVVSSEPCEMSVVPRVIVLINPCIIVFFCHHFRTFPEITHRVYFTIAIDGQEAEEKIVFGLFGTNTPKTVENFVALVQCDQGNGKISGKPLCYKGTPLHRVVPSFGITGKCSSRNVFIMQGNIMASDCFLCSCHFYIGGDFVYGNGTGGESIFGGFFEDESFSVRHNRAGLISMANRGRNTNGSQFFINTSKVREAFSRGKRFVLSVVLFAFAHTCVGGCFCFCLPDRPNG